MKNTEKRPKLTEAEIKLRKKIYMARFWGRQRAAQAAYRAVMLATR